MLTKQCVMNSKSLKHKQEPIHRKMEFYKSNMSDNPKSLLDYHEMHYFPDYSWDIKEQPDTAICEGQPLTHDEGSKVHNTDFHTAYIIVPLSRFYEVMDIIPIGKELSFNNVANSIYNFYHKALTAEQIEEIKSYPRDPFDYTDDLLKRAATGEKVCYADLRGDSVEFEGITRVSANIYELYLGS